MPAQAHNAHPKRRTNEGAENYAKALYELQGRDASPVGTTAVASELSDLSIGESRTKATVTATA